MYRVKINCEVLTPLFNYSINNKLELRAESIKGLLRFWWRAKEAYKYSDCISLRNAENKKFGGLIEKEGEKVYIKSPFNILIKNNLRSETKKFDKSGLSYLYFFLDKYYKPGGEFSIIMISKKKKVLKEIIELLEIMSVLGGIGSRSRKTGGNFLIKSIESTQIEYNLYNFDSFEDVSNFFNRLKKDTNSRGIENNITNISSAEIYNIHLKRKNIYILLDKIGATYKSFRKSIRNKSSIDDLLIFGAPIKGSAKLGSSRFPSKIILKVMKNRRDEYFAYIVKLGGKVVVDGEKYKLKNNLIQEFISSFK